MGGGLQHVVGQALQHVADVDHDGVGVGRERHPLALARQDFQTGGAGAEMKIAASEGVDTFITGEGPHWTYALAEDLGPA